MGSTNGQRRVDGRAQGQSVGANAVVGYNAVHLSSLETHNIEQKQMPSCNMGEEVNGHPTIKGVVGSSNSKTKFERLGDEVGLIHCVVLSVSIL
jgi:hypothetical protein